MSTPSVPQLPQAYHLQQAQKNAFGDIGGLSQQPNYGLQAYQQVQNYNQQVQQGPGYDTGAVNNAGQQVLQGAGQLGGFANQVQQTAMDPQNALYNRTLQQTQDQQRQGQAARGIAMTPYGAGLENQAVQNFNIDWQNNQLQRQTQGLGAAGTALGQQSQASQMGAGILQSVPAQQRQQQLQALGALASGSSLPTAQMQQIISDWMSYISGGNQTNQNALNAQAQAAQQSSSMWGGIGSLGGALIGAIL